MAALLQALDAHGWQLKEAAEALGVSRPSIYNLMARWLDTPQVDDLTAGQLAPLLAHLVGRAAPGEDDTDQQQAGDGQREEGDPVAHAWTGTAP